MRSNRRRYNFSKRRGSPSPNSELVSVESQTKRGEMRGAFAGVPSGAAGTLRRVLLMALLAVVVAGCSLTKYVPDDEYLLDKVELQGDKGGVADEELLDYVRQQPNSRFLHLWRVGLGVYSLSGRSPRRFNEWLRSVGHEPVCYDSAQAKRSAGQLELFLRSKGYYDACVTGSMVTTAEKRCRVIYTLSAGQVYKISSLARSVPDDEVGRLILSDTANSLLRVGAPFDSNVHDAERERIARMLQERGYWAFGKDYIYFVADSAGLDHAVRDSLVVLPAPQGREAHSQGDKATRAHRKAVIAQVRLLVDNSHEGQGRGTMSPMDQDTLPCAEVDTAITVSYTGDPIFRADILNNSCFVRPGATYSISDVEQSRARITQQKIFRQATFQFSEMDTASAKTLFAETGRAMASWPDSVVPLSCVGRLVTNKLQSFGFDVEGTNSSGNLGAALSVRYSHANLFHGAEALSLKARVSTQRQSAVDGKEEFWTLETGLEASLRLPFMVAPFTSLHFYKNHSPHTILSASYDMQRRPEFTRTVVATRMTYNWAGSPYVQHSLTPTELNVVSIPVIDQGFRDYISGTYLQYAYTDHFIMSFCYAFSYNQQRVKRNQSGIYARFALETAGNVLNLCVGRKAGEEFKEICGIRFSQYLRGEAEFRYLAVDPTGNNVAFRIFGGVGVPYGNSVVLPFEKQFFVGGPNSIRAWAVRGLGPGSQKSDPKLRYHNQTSDIRLEANAEYRFKIFSVFEGAAFVDAGNIWALNRRVKTQGEPDPDAVFSKDFFKQIALGAGLGLRLNFDFFVFRVDAAYKLRDPSADGNRWVVTRRFDGSEIAWNFAIGYPF